jgi:hypothetical protein
MSFTKQEICNMTVAHCGIGTDISDIEEDDTNEAIQCRKFYDRCVELLLEMLPWPFAEKRFTPTNLGSPPDDWSYRYLYPNDCKRINKIVNLSKRTDDTVSDKLPYKIIKYGTTGRAILTDVEDMEFDGNEWVTDESLFSATFAMALSQFIATFAAVPLRAKKEVVDDVRKQWAMWLSEAQVQAKAEQQSDTPRDSEFVYARS